MPSGRSVASTVIFGYFARKLDISAVAQLSSMANGYPISDNRVASKLFNDFLLLETRHLMGDEICDAFEIPRAPVGLVIALVVALLHRALGAMKRVPITRPAYAWMSEFYWEKGVPAMLERLTGHAQMTYADAAKVKH